jgi:hypothetical protein
MALLFVSSRFASTGRCIRRRPAARRPRRTTMPGCRARGPRRRSRPAVPGDGRGGGGRLRVQFAGGGHALDHGGVDRAGADGVDPHPARPVFEGCRLGESDHPVLGGVVGRPSGVADQASDGGAVDDGAVSLLSHLGEFVFHRRPHAAQVHGCDRVETVCGFVGRVGGRDHDAGVVERHIEPAEAVDGGAYGGLDLSLVGHIAGDREHGVPLRRELLRGLVHEFGVSVGENRRGAALGEGAGSGETHPGARPRDERDRAREVVPNSH